MFKLFVDEVLAGTHRILTKTIEARLTLGGPKYWTKKLYTISFVFEYLYQMIKILERNHLKVKTNYLFAFNEYRYLIIILVQLMQVLNFGPLDII